MIKEERFPEVTDLLFKAYPLAKVQVSLQKGKREKSGIGTINTLLDQIDTHLKEIEFPIDLVHLLTTLNPASKVQWEAHVTKLLKELQPFTKSLPKRRPKDEDFPLLSYVGFLDQLFLGDDLHAEEQHAPSNEETANNDDLVRGYLLDFLSLGALGESEEIQDEYRSHITKKFTPTLKQSFQDYIEGRPITDTVKVTQLNPAQAHLIRTFLHAFHQIYPLKR